MHFLTAEQVAKLAAAVGPEWETLVYTAAKRIKKRIDDGRDPFEAFTDVQNHLVAVANANVERVVGNALFDGFRVGHR